MTETRRLSMRALGALRADVARPLYDRASVKPGIVHLGIGNFHRAHQAVYVDDCLAAGETDWGIVGVSLRSSDMRDALAAQDGLYALAVRGPDRTDLRVVGSILDVMVAPENPAALVARMAHPDTRIVTLTVTEKAYLRAASGALDMMDHVSVRNLAETLEELAALGYQTVGLDSEGPHILEDSLAGDRVALVLGAEGKGLRQKTRQTCATLARIDLPGEIKSLNVSNAAALSLYVTRRFLDR